MNKKKLMKCNECGAEYGPEEDKYMPFCSHNCALDAEYGPTEVEPKTVYITVGRNESF